MGQAVTVAGNRGSAYVGWHRAGTRRFTKALRWPFCAALLFLFLITTGCANHTDRTLARHGLRRGHLVGVVAAGADLRLVSLPGEDLTGADLRRVNLGGAYLAGALLGKARMERADLGAVEVGWFRRRWQGADLSRAVLAEANLAGARVMGASFRDADLESANLSDVDMGVARVGGVYMSGADCTGANLRNANVRGACLCSSFAGAVLDGVDLRQAKQVAGVFEKASLRGSDLRGVDLRNTLGLETADLTGALYSRRTRWPPGFSAVASRAVLTP